MDKILNCTQHTATEDQKSSGVFDMADEFRQALRALLTFNEIPTFRELYRRSRAIVALVDIHDLGPGAKVMLGGAPWLMPVLEATMEDHGYMPVYSFSARVSEDTMEQNGEVRKTTTFKHVGFVTPKENIEDE